MHLSLVTLVLALVAASAAPALASHESTTHSATLTKRAPGFQKRVRRSAGTGLEARAGTLDERALVIPNVKKRTSAKTYSALVAIGASYTGALVPPTRDAASRLTLAPSLRLARAPKRSDNAHSRASKYAGSLRDYHPYSKWEGRYSNGKVAVEYMAEAGLKKASGGLELLDCASSPCSLSLSKAPC